VQTPAKPYKEIIMLTARKMRKLTIGAVGLAAAASAACGLVGISRASEADQHRSREAEAEHHTNVHRESSRLPLSHELMALLNEEMGKIEEGMMKIIPAISAGDWETIAGTAHEIKDSFILKQKLAPKQMEELHHALPPEFLEMDRGFHSSAGKLAQAAHAQDGELVNFYFYKLHTQCMKCHSKYASGRFPDLKKVQRTEDGHH
jgi:hypothetical protein